MNAFRNGIRCVMAMGMSFMLTTNVFAASTAQAQTEATKSQKATTQTTTQATTRAAAQATTQAATLGKSMSAQVDNSMLAATLGDSLTSLSSLYTSLNLEGTSAQLSMPKLEALTLSGNDWLADALSVVDMDGIDTSKFTIVDMPDDAEYLNARYALLQTEFDAMGFGSEMTLSDKSIDLFSGTASDQFRLQWGFDGSDVSLQQATLPSGFGSGYKEYDIPSDFDTGAILSSFSSSIDSAYSAFMDSDEYNLVKENISLANVSERIAELSNKTYTLSTAELASTLSSLENDATGGAGGFAALSTYYQNQQNWENGYTSALADNYSSLSQSQADTAAAKFEAIKDSMASDSFLNSVKLSMATLNNTSKADVNDSSDQAEKEQSYNESDGLVASDGIFEEKDYYDGTSLSAATYSSVTAALAANEAKAIEEANIDDEKLNSSLLSTTSAFKENISSTASNFSSTTSLDEDGTSSASADIGYLDIDGIDGSSLTAGFVDSRGNLYDMAGNRLQKSGLVSEGATTDTGTVSTMTDVIYYVKNGVYYYGLDPR